MPSPTVQLILVNMLLGTLAVVIVLGGPLAPAVVGAVGAGALLYALDRWLRQWFNFVPPQRKDADRPKTATTVHVG